MLEELGLPLFDQRTPILVRARRQERRPCVSRLAEHGSVFDRRGVVEVAGVLLAVLAAVAEAKQLLAQGLAVQGVGTSKAVLDDHVEIALIFFVDGLEVALFVCDLGVEHLYHRSQPINLLILR